MKLSEFKKIIREEAESILIESKQPINEGIVDSIISAIVNKVIKSKYKKYFDELHNDPEYKEALTAVNKAAEKISTAAKSYEKYKAKSDKEYNEYVKKYGKKAADKIVSDTLASTYRLSWKKPIIPKKYKD